MDTTYGRLQDDRFGESEISYDLNQWFLVSGDADDFIFYGETDKPHSEK